MGNRLIPYVVFPVQDEASEYVRLGPFASHDSNRHAAANMLVDFKYKKDVAVKLSQLKMR